MENTWEAYYKSKVIIYDKEVSSEFVKNAIQNYGGDALVELDVRQINDKVFIVEFIEETSGFDNPSKVVADVIIDSALWDAGIDDFEHKLIEFNYDEELSWDN